MVLKQLLLCSLFLFIVSTSQENRDEGKETDEHNAVSQRKSPYDCDKKRMSSSNSLYLDLSNWGIGRGRKSFASSVSSSLKWCYSKGCNVRKYSKCCYAPKCRYRNFEHCRWIDYLTGNDPFLETQKHSLKNARAPLIW